MSTSLLRYENFSLSFGTGRREKFAVRELSLEIGVGERIALVGESGSGKTLTALSPLRLQPEGAHLTGKIYWRRADGTEVNLLDLSLEQIREIRGREIAMIFQEPLTALNPVMRCGEQLEECFRQSFPAMKQASRQKAMRDALAEVQLNDVSRMLSAYPHQLSGGQRQRWMIAMALAGNPSLLIADEPTTALDVEVQAGLVLLLRDLQRQRSLSLWFISHDLPLMSGLVDRAALMHRGRLVEQGSCPQVWNSSDYPRFAALLSAKPHGIPLSPPMVRSQVAPVLEAKDLSWTTATGLKAVNQVSFQLEAGETLGVVGGSGSGKSSLARMIAGLLKPSSGELTYTQKPLWTGGRYTDDPQVRLGIQMVFQDPYSSLNPAHSIQKMLCMALQQRYPELPASELLRRAGDWLQRVQMDPEKALRRRPAAFSGGQRQRLALARAVAAKPAVLVLDDPLSALDVDTEAMVEDALRTVLKATTALIVAHRPSTVQLADKVALMQDGKITAVGKHSELLATNEHYRFVISSLDAAGDLIEVK